MHHQVLIYGHDSILLRTRQLLLERAGFEVRVSEIEDEVHGILSTRPVDLLILCHTVDLKERSSILATVRACQKNPSILLLSADFQSPPVTENDVVFSTLEGPRSFLQTVCQLTHEPAAFPSVRNSPNSGQELCHDSQVR